MAGYFDPESGSVDRKMLPNWTAGRDLADLAIRVEAEIVAHFTIDTFNGPAYAFRQTDQGQVLDSGPLAGLVKLADNLYVQLRGYSETVASAEARFAAAFRREIAEVMVWRLGMAERRPGTKSESDGDTTRTYADNADDPFPSAFPRHLGPFIVGEEIYVA